MRNDGMRVIRDRVWIGTADMSMALVEDCTLHYSLVAFLTVNFSYIGLMINSPTSRASPSMQSYPTSK